jgi:hypothetical protein
MRTGYCGRRAAIGLVGCLVDDHARIDAAVYMGNLLAV